MARAKSISASIPTLRRMFVRFWPFIRKQRLPIVGSIVALFAEVGLRVLEPWPLAFVIDHVLTAKPVVTGGGTGAGTGSGAAGWSAALDRLNPETIVVLCASAVILVAVARGGASYLRRVGFALAGSRVLTQCRGELFSHLQRLSLSFHSKKRSGDLIMRVTGDIGRVSEVTTTAAMPLVAHVITLIAMVTVMFFMQWRLALIAVAIMPLFLLSTLRIGGRIRKVARKQRERQGEIGATAVEAIGSIKTVQSLALEDVHARTFAASNKSDLREGVRAKRLSARLIVTAEILIALASAAVLWGGSRMVLHGGDLTLGQLLVFLAYVKTALRPIRNLAKYAGRIAKASASAERIIEVLETTPLIQDRPGAIKVPAVIDAVSFEGVTFGYQPEQIAVSDLSIDARRGDVIVLAGPSGAGKSTIVNLLLRLYDASEGRVTIEGRDIRDYTIESLRRRIAVVPQENVLFAVSIRDNIAYGSPGATEEQIVAAARLAEAHEFIMAQPSGYDTVVGERGASLSEGQRQRISIARAAVREAPILVLDEPTASLDNENNVLVRDAFHVLSRDRLCFIIAHDLSTVGDDDRVLFLDGGRIVEQGTHAELVGRKGRYAAMYALQQPSAIGPEREHAVSG